MIIEYLKRLFSKWFVYLGLLPAIDDLIERYLTISLSIPSIVLYFVAFCAFIYATYQVWNDMRVEKEELEEKLKNPVDYEIKAYAKKIVFDIEYAEKKIVENIKEAQNIIKKSSKELDKLQEKPDENSLSGKLEMFRSMQSLGIYENDSYETSKVIYMAELSKYIDELKNFPSKKDECLDKYKEVIENKLKDLYMLDFVISNCGIKFDEDIDIVLEFGEKNEYLESGYISLNLPKCILLPSKPEIKLINDFTTISKPIFDNNDFEFIKDSNPLVYRRYEKIEDKQFSIKLRDLKVSKSVRIFKNDSYLFKIEDKNSMKCTITSKNSTSKIIKNIIFENDGEFDFFNKTNSQGEEK
ncbi:hypothetical protein [Arcobacter porcinus]|uniref:hypothetical protein n=1 Tax=Arcobacter porcinus TaxID=1935204 RepID=UPI00081E8C4B|nr:hypothetical protein [Arcobacter porcinus]OCL82737.1 hypothetical protein AAW29_01125 [Arcobacter porcinus]